MNRSLKDLEQKSNDFKKPENPVTCVIIGAGQRGRVYASYAETNPDEWKVVGVAEPNQLRNQQMAEKHDVPAENCFTDWDEVFNRPKFADVVVVATSDALHYEPAMKALEMGYDILLEKVVAQTWEECNAILQKAKELNRIVTVAHVLRYTPYFRKIKQIVDSGIIGELVSVQHMEAIEHEHMSHSYVRGNWGNAEKSTPIVLSKSYQHRKTRIMGTQGDIVGDGHKLEVFNFITREKEEWDVRD